MITAVFGFVLGSVLGSFIKATADRIITKKPLRGRSYCLGCKHQLAWHDLLPVFSFLLLEGKCRYCKKVIPRDNFLIEIFLGLVVALLFYTFVSPNIGLLFNPTWQTPLFLVELFFKLFVIAILVIIFLVDFKTGLIHNKITYPGIILSFAYLLFSSGLKSWFYYQGLAEGPLGKYLTPPYSNYVYGYIGRIWIPAGLAILSAILMAGFFALLIILTKGKGMGWGDVKYVFFLGLVLGFPNIIVGVFLAFLIGAIFSLLLIAAGKKHFGQTIPFGPFLSLGAGIALFWGEKIINWYLGGMHF